MFNLPIDMLIRNNEFHLLKTIFSWNWLMLLKISELFQKLNIKIFFRLENRKLEKWFF